MYNLVMGPLSHVYVSTKVTGKLTPLLIFGSTLPDISWGSSNQFGKEKIHYAPKEFYQFIKHRYPNMLDLGVGVRLHTSVEHGADYYSDDRKEGFAYSMAPALAEQVADLLELKTKGVAIPWKYGLKINSNSLIGRWKKANDTIALVLAHNFVEAGVDLNLLENKQSLVKHYKEGLAKLDLEKIVLLLADCLQVKVSIVAQEIQRFIKMISYSTTNIEVIAKETAVPLLTTMFGREPDSKKIANILLKAKNITKPNYLVWLDGAAKQMKIDFAGLINQIQ